MIHSMTAFSRQQKAFPWGTIVWEVRSVNQRFLETYFRQPEAFRELEPKLREFVRGKLKRGKVESTLRFEAAESLEGDVAVNQALAKQLSEALNTLSEHFDNTQPIDLVTLMRWPGLLATPEADFAEIHKAALDLYSDAIKDLISVRKREGEQLKNIILERVAGLLEQVEFVRQRMPDIMKWQRQRIKDRFEEANVEMDNDRVEQEMVLLAQRVDVAEELDRLDTHLTEVKRVASEGGSVGRRLDFLMQELNREANTLSSKSINAEITSASVEMKVLIEQMREQIQNIE